MWERGELIIDETVMPKPLATALAGLAWVFSSQARKPVSGRCLVLRVWTEGTLRIPLGIRLWRTGGPAKDEWALALRREARHRLRCHPDVVLCEAWYPARALLKRMRAYGGSVVCRLTKNRRFKGHALRHHRRHPSGAEGGGLNGGLKGLVVRDGQKDYATKRLTLPAAEVRRRYRVRAQREAVIRVCTDPWGLTGCQARADKAQQHPMACCLVAVCVLERAR